MQSPLPFFLPLLFVSALATAQVRLVTIRPKVPVPPKTVTATPFRSVRVVDNRSDTASIYTIEDGRYPVRRVTFALPAGQALEDCMNGWISRLARGKEDLVVNLRQLYVPNDPRLGSSLVFSAEAFVRTPDGLYRKLVSVAHWHPGTASPGLAHTIAKASAEFVEVAGIALQRTQGLAVTVRPAIQQLLDKPSVFVFAGPDERVYPDQVGAVRKDHPIDASPDTAVGFYSTFKDFRNNRLSADPIHLSMTGDSCYLLGEHLRVWPYPWAVCDGRNLYILYEDGRYLPLQRDASGYHFFVPRSLPDMYSTLCQKQRVSNAGDASFPSSGGPDASKIDLKSALFLIGVYLVLAGGYEIAISASRAHHQHMGLRHDFRFCTVDMETGDIRYATDGYP